MAGIRVTGPSKFGVGDSVGVSTSKSYEYDSGRCLSFEVWASITTDPSSTDGVDVSIKRKAGPGGVVADGGLTKSVAATASGVLYMGIYDPGTVDIEVKNNDGSYAATINGIWVREAV